MTEVGEVWTREELVSKTAVVKDPKDESKSETLKGAEAVEKNPLLWGQPGFLSEEEANVYFKFKEELASRDAAFQNTVYCFGREEGEVWALCRWLRARKYVYEDVIKMIEEATETRKEAAIANFYPEPEKALGCDVGLYYAQFPQLYSGFAKNGAPLFISKPGKLNVDAVECITNLQSIVKFHWYIMMHDFANRLRSQKAKDENFKRFDCVCVLDLSGLAMSQITSKALAIIKEQSAIDSVCFPETMQKMYLINGPSFFSATWKLIKGWLDPRTAAKIEVISSKKKWTEKLLELFEPDQLPSDYGGTGPDTQATIEKEAFTGNLKKLDTEVLYLRGHGSVTYEIPAGMECEVSVFTNDTNGAAITLADQSGGPGWGKDILVKHTGATDENAIPTKTVVTTQNIKGPAKLKVKADTKGSRWTLYNYLVVYSLYSV